ncbi:MAG: helix-turn-helix domain-containing protein [Cyanobacteriota bacterium]|nr:helix-turn-helix domain-containing protein [Cyanobacteriota bacterium]
MSPPNPRWPPSPPALSRLLPMVRHWRRGRAASSPQLGGRDRQGSDPLPQVGEQVRRAREAQGLNLRQLANDTRISTTVLEAIERGWRDRLPEGTYLRSMLPLLERRLDLPTGSLTPILAPSRSLAGRNPTRPGQVRRFTPGSIDVFTTWQGTVIYGLLALALIHALNLQQRHLAALQRLTLMPLPVGGPVAGAASTAAAEEGDRLSRAYPGLRPLSEPLRPRLLQALGRESRGSAAHQQQGRLQLRLDQSSNLVLRSGRPMERTSTRLDGVRGQLDLWVQPPFDLELGPAPAAGSVRWRGLPLVAADGTGRRFTYPPAERTRP